MLIKGVDISEHSQSVNWQKMKDEGFQFAYARAFNGAREDNYFSKYWSALKKYNIIRGAYTFFLPSNDLDFQVRHFAQVVDIDSGDLPPVIDLEYYKSQWLNRSTPESIDLTAKLLQAIERATGYKPIIYTSEDFWTNQMGNTSHFSEAGYDLWIANWLTPPNHPNKLFGGWKIHTFHQYLGDIKNASFTQDVDYDAFNGDIDRLKAETVTEVALAEGRIGLKVSDLQKRLSKLANNPNHPQPDLDPQEIDGIFGPNTKKAVIAFQKANNLAADGSINLKQVPDLVTV